MSMKKYKFVSSCRGDATARKTHVFRFYYKILFLLFICHELELDIT